MNNLGGKFFAYSLEVEIFHPRDDGAHEQWFIGCSQSAVVSAGLFACSSALGSGSGSVTFIIFSTLRIYTKSLDSGLDEVCFNVST